MRITKVENGFGKVCSLILQTLVTHNVLMAVLPAQHHWLLASTVTKVRILTWTLRLCLSWFSLACMNAFPNSIPFKLDVDAYRTIRKYISRKAIRNGFITDIFYLMISLTILFPPRNVWRVRISESRADSSQLPIFLLRTKTTPLQKKSTGR
jgi:hypothetical protein